MSELRELEELRRQQAEINQRIAQIEQRSTQAAYARLAEIVVSIEALVEEGGKLSEEYEIPFQFQYKDRDGYGMTMDVSRFWQSSSAYC